MPGYKEWRKVLESALPKLYGAGPDRELTVAEILAVAPELGIVRDVPEALTRRSPMYAAGYCLQRWQHTNPRKFHIRRVEP